MTLDELTRSIEIAETGIPQVRRREKARIYACGLRAKLRQAIFALDMLKSFDNRSDSNTTTTADNEPSIREYVEFYCDSFWAFLYSSLDVLAQYINQVMKLELDEKNVSFKRVQSVLKARNPSSPLAEAMENCRNARYFKNLDKYRNCSTHRRQIFIEETTITVDRTDGYATSTSGELTTVDRIICDDPLSITPTTNQQRHIPDYLERAYDSIYARIEEMVSVTNAVS